MINVKNQEKKLKIIFLMQPEGKHWLLRPSFQICFQIPSWRPFATTYTPIMILSTIGEGDGQDESLTCPL